MSKCFFEVFWTWKRLVIMITYYHYNHNVPQTIHQFLCEINELAAVMAIQVLCFVACRYVSRRECFTNFLREHLQFAITWWRFLCNRVMVFYYSSSSTRAWWAITGIAQFNRWRLCFRIQWLKSQRINVQSHYSDITKIPLRMSLYKAMCWKRVAATQQNKVHFLFVLSANTHNMKSVLKISTKIK